MIALIIFLSFVPYTMLVSWILKRRHKKTCDELRKIYVQLGISKLEEFANKED